MCLLTICTYGFVYVWIMQLSIVSGAWMSCLDVCPGTIGMDGLDKWIRPQEDVTHKQRFTCYANKSRRP